MVIADLYISELELLRPLLKTKVGLDQETSSSTQRKAKGLAPTPAPHRLDGFLAVPCQLQLLTDS